MDYAGCSVREAARLAGCSPSAAHALTRARPSLPVALLERAMMVLDLARAEALLGTIMTTPAGLTLAGIGGSR